MVTEDQTEIIEFLSRSSTHGGSTVERFETHASVVFLAGDCAWKLKRAVRYDYLDFSTAERRRVLCEEEVRINRRTAPTVYRRAVAVTREVDRSLAIDGSGTPVDWLVEMSRFPQDALFDRLAGRGALTLDLMRALAAAIARFHSGAAISARRGGTHGMAWVIDGNASGFREQNTGLLDPALCEQVTREARAALQRSAALLDRRAEAGFVRQCHGDLHLRNIVLLDGEPTPFDAIEFNDDLACIDVLYDLAFLLMDLWRRGLPRHSNEVWNRYLSETIDFGGVSLLPLFLSCRAAVRAKTSATAAALQSDAARRHELERFAREYLQMALALLQPPGPCLLAVGGLSGSGKSTLARALAASLGAVPGALVLRSDEIRKRLCGVPELTRLGKAGYTPQVSRRVYDTLAERASSIIEAGHAAIVDAVFTRARDRHAIERIAARAGVTFVGLWLDAPEPVLVDRIERRASDASDADAAVIRSQIAQAAGAMAWHRIDAALDAEVVRQQAAAICNRAGLALRSQTS